MHLETFAHGHSLPHRLDPRGKLAVALGFSLLIALAPGRLAQLAGLLLGMAAVALARLPLGELSKRLAGVNAFLALLWLMLPWSLEAGPGFLGLTLVPQPRGVDLALAITLKANGIILLLLGLVSTSPINHVFHALAHWNTPTKLLHLFFFFYRYLHVLHREYHRLTWGMRVRGFTPRSDWHTYRTYAHLVGMLLVRSHDRAERVYQAMLCRGFDGTYWVLDHFAWHRRDSFFLTGALALFLGLAGLALGGR